MDPRFRQKLRQLTWPSLSKDVLSTFPHFFFAKFLHFHIFKTYFHILEYEAFQILFPLLNFQISQFWKFYLIFLLVLFIFKKKRGKSGKKSCPIRSCFSCLYSKKKEEKFEKSCSIRTDFLLFFLEKKKENLEEVAR